MQNNKNNNQNLIFKRVSLAPMAGITDIVLRKLVREYSATCLITTEMISSEGLNHVHDSAIIKTCETDSPIAFQISGHKPDLMAKSAKFLESAYHFELQSLITPTLNPCGSIFCPMT